MHLSSCVHLLTSQALVLQYGVLGKHSTDEMMMSYHCLVQSVQKSGRKGPFRYPYD